MEIELEASAEVVELRLGFWFCQLLVKFTGNLQLGQLLNTLEKQKFKTALLN